MTRRWAAGAVAMTMMLGLAASAEAATLQVTTTADDPSADCTGGACSLRAAVAVANASPGSVIQIADGGAVTLTNGPLAVTGDGTVIQGVPGLPGQILATSGRAFDIQAGNVMLRDLYVGAQTVQPNTGGIDFHPAGQDDQLTLLDVNVVHGDAAQGGGIRVSAGSLALFDSTISDNSAGLGGGIYATDGAAVVSDGSAITRNHSTGAGGGVELDGAGMLVQNSTIGGNSSAGAGAAVAVKNAAALLMFNATIARNDAGGDGALASLDASSGFLFVNSILGEPGDVPVCKLNGAQVIDDHSLSADDTCGLNAANGSIVGVDPRLGAWSTSWGGPTATFEISPDSPIVDAANSDPSACPNVDQAYRPRPQGNGCDIGAIETSWSRGLPATNPPAGGGGGGGGGAPSARDAAPSASSDASASTPPAAPPVTAPAPTATAPTPPPIVFARSGSLSVGATLHAAPKGKVTLAWVVRKGGRDHRGQFDVSASGSLLTTVKALPAKLKGGRLVRLTAIYRDASGKRHVERLVPAS